MIIVGERINTSRKAIGAAVASRDVAFIQNEAKQQFEAGATHIDVNAGTLVYEEPEALEWLVRIVQEVVDAPLCIDSPNPKAIERALKSHRGKAIINSITAEKERFNAILPLVKDYGCSVVALCMDDSGMPETANDRLRIVKVLADSLTKKGIKPDDVYFDPLVKPISTGSQSGMEVLDTIRRIIKDFPGYHTICGLSNISFGLPNRKHLNQSFLVMCIGAGMDSFIVDPLDQRLMANLYAARALAGMDKFCLQYLKAHRAGMFEFKKENSLF
jgi:cobalamin-dependent methionine synthase I